MQVLQWMEDAGIQPSYGMFRDIVSFAQTRGGAEYAAIIQERIGKLVFISGKKIISFFSYFLCFSNSCETFPHHHVQC